MVSERDWYRSSSVSLGFNVDSSFLLTLKIPTDSFGAWLCWNMCLAIVERALPLPDSFLAFYQHWAASPSGADLKGPVSSFKQNELNSSVRAQTAHSNSEQRIEVGRAGSWTEDSALSALYCWDFFLWIQTSWWLILKKWVMGKPLYCAITVFPVLHGNRVSYSQSQGSTSCPCI